MPLAKKLGLMELFLWNLSSIKLETKSLAEIFLTKFQVGWFLFSYFMVPEYLFCKDADGQWLQCVIYFVKYLYKFLI